MRRARLQVTTQIQGPRALRTAHVLRRVLLRPGTVGRDGGLPLRTRAALLVLLLLPFAAALAPPSEPLTPAAATGASVGEIELSWTPPAAAGASPVAGYRIYRSLTPTGLVHLIDLGNVLAYTDLGIPDGRPRYYRFSAVNGDGEGPLSSVVSATAKAPPSEPQNVSIARSEAIGRGNLSLVWNVPQYAGNDPVASYNVYRSPDNVTFTFLASAITLDHKDSGLGDNATNYYYVAGVNAFGEGLPSPARPGSSPGVPYPPANFTVGSFPVLGVSIFWERPEEGGLNITSYVLNRSIGSDPEKVLRVFRRDQTGFTDRECPITKICTYRVTARNPVGFGNPTAAMAIRGTQLPLVG